MLRAGDYRIEAIWVTRGTYFGMCQVILEPGRRRGSGLGIAAGGLFVCLVIGRLGAGSHSLVRSATSSEKWLRVGANNHTCLCLPDNNLKSAQFITWALGSGTHARSDRYCRQWSVVSGQWSVAVSGTGSGGDTARQVRDFGHWAPAWGTGFPALMPRF
ncbi:hypothetical protein CIB48_g11538 [Xylaria polymorpha]|nr:hypothetical protein CIB48_g11538 [Xylaria polymorpha]